MLVHLDIFSEIGSTIWTAIRSLIAVICATLYGYIIDLYNVFMIIARANVLDNEYIQLIYRRVGLILSLFMIFKLAFSLIQSLIEPDKFTDKKNGFASIIKRIIIAIVLLGTTPTLFKFARSFQSVVVGTENDSNNVLYRLIVADDVISTSNSSFGRRLATDLFFSFFRENKDRPYYGGIKITDVGGQTIIQKNDYKSLYEACLNGEDNGQEFSFDDLVYYMSLSEGGSYCFEWDIILSVGAAIAVLWILVNYCVSIAMRTIQLAYLQLVSPIPILSYIGDPDGAFKKWLKQCSSTYLELFMRLGILYFIITMCGKILDILSVDDELQSSVGITKESSEYVLVKVFLIIGLLMFGKRVPELLKELFPGDGKFDLGIKSPKKLLNDIPGGNLAYKTAKGAAIGAGLGVVGAGVSGISRYKSNRAAGKSVGKSLLGGAYGFGAGTVGGIKSGFTKKGVSGGWKNIQESNNKYNKLITTGGTTFGTFKARLGNTLGESEGQRFSRMIANYQKVIDDNKYVNDVAEEFSEVKKLKTRWETLRMSGAGEDEILNAFGTYKEAKKAALTAALQGKSDFSYSEVIGRDAVTGANIYSNTVNNRDLNDFEDTAISGRIQVRGSDTEDFINSHNVQLFDEHGTRITKLDSSVAFKTASTSASKSQTEIYKNNDYGAAMANDAAVGNDSNKNVHKDKGGH